VSAEKERPYLAERSLFGRNRVVQMVWEEWLGRPRRAPRALPVIALLGPHGSGKTEVLNYLAEECRMQAAQPFAPVFDLAGSNVTQHGWQVVAWLAYQLSGQVWPQFGRLRFPRFALGRIIVEGAVGTESLEQTQQAIEGLLRKAAHLDRAAQDVADLTTQLPQLLGGTNWLGFLGQVGGRALSSRLAVRLRFRTGMAFYGEVLRNRANGGFPALVELSRLKREFSKVSQDMINRVLCEAFLADLTEGYGHGFRPRNCLVLVDNIDDENGVGRAFLSALTAAKTKQADLNDPLVAVVTSRQTAPIAPVLDAVGIPTTPTEAWLRQDGRASYQDWLNSRPAPHSWLYPVRLADLDEETVLEVARVLFPDAASSAGFVYSLTKGHPWGVGQVLATLAAIRGPNELAHRLSEDELRNVLDSPCPGHGAMLGDLAVEELVLTDLPQQLGNRLFACSAALDVITAQRAGLAGRIALEAELAHRFWLVPGNNPQHPIAAIHPWLRRLLLRKLAPRKDNGATNQPQDGPRSSWTVIHHALRRHCADTPVPASYYELAVNQFNGAANWLNAQFDLITENSAVSVESWIADFNTITSAPHQHICHPSAAKRHQKLLSDLQLAAGAPLDEQRTTILTLATARSIWSDPLGDPMLTLNSILANGFRDLALRCPWGQLRLIAEAEFYERGGRP
jgi:hypothetical protein